MLAAGKLSSAGCSLFCPCRSPTDLAGRADGLAFGPAGDHQRDRGIFGGGQGGQEVVLLEHEADAPARKLVFCGRSSWSTTCAEDRVTSPLSQSRMPAMTDSRVVLPQPDGPTIKDIWPA